MIKPLFLTYFICISSFASVCSEHAALLATLKLKDMLTGYGENYVHKIKDNESILSVDENPFNHAHICKIPEIEESIVYVKREYFRACNLKSVAESLDTSSNSLAGERVEVSMQKHILAEDCSPKEALEMERNFAYAVKMVNNELSKKKSNITKVCNIGRKALGLNYEIRRRCRE